MANLSPNQPLRFISCGHTVSTTPTSTSRSTSHSSSSSRTNSTATTSTTIFPPNPQIHVPSLSIVTPSNCFPCSLAIARRNSRDVRGFWETRMRDARAEFVSRGARSRTQSRRNGSGDGRAGAGAGDGYDYAHEYDHHRDHHQEDEEVEAGQRTLDEIWRSQLRHLHRRMQEGVMEVWFGFGDVWEGATRPATSGGFGGVLGYAGRRAVREVVSVRVNLGRAVVRLEWRDEVGRVVGVEEVGMY